MTINSVSKVHPVANRLLVEQFQLKTKTKAGLLLPEENKVDMLYAKVLSVGPGTNDDPILCKEGDTVLLRKFAGVQVVINEKPCLIIQNADILGIDNSIQPDA